MSDECIKCYRPRFITEKGRVLAHCEFHCSYNRKERTEKWQARPYAPNQNLFNLSAFKNLPLVDLAFAAGLIEGEGWIGPDSCLKTQGRAYPVIKVKMTDKEPILWLHSIFGGSTQIVEAEGNRKRAWVWLARGRRAGAIAAATVHFYKAPRKRKAALMVVRVASICGWWRRCKLDPRGLKILAKLKESVIAWRTENQCRSGLEITN